MATKREKPSTKARRDGYAQLHKLRHFLYKILRVKSSPYTYAANYDEEHWLEVEFNKNGWRDYMIRHTPALKRGGPDVQIPGKSKRRRQKRADRQSTIR